LAGRGSAARSGVRHDRSDSWELAAALWASSVL